MDSAFVRCYSLHGLNLIVQGEEKALVDESELLFAFLPFEESERINTRFHITLKFAFSRKPAPIPRDSSKPYIVNDISIFDTNSSVIITDGYSTFRIKPWSEIGIVTIHPSFKQKKLASKFNFYLLGLAYLFSYQGFFDLHGAALSNHGIGYLFLGESKSGKSSISLSLVRQGWHYASDDSLLLKSNGKDVDVLSFRKNFYIDQKVVSKYPELVSLFSNENDMEGSKRFLDLDQIYPDQFQPSIFPKVLIFTNIISQKKSSIQLLSKGQAFANLLKQSISIFFNRQVVTQHTQILKKLINQCSCYQLLAGRDLYDEPGAILKLLPHNH
jgi:hypothetical protein